MSPEQIGALVLMLIACMVLGGLITLLLSAFIEYSCEAWEHRQPAKAEKRLDEQSEEMRQTILSLAESLAADKDEASRAMARAIFLTTGQIVGT